jgi:hypothetical protein
MTCPICGGDTYCFCIKSGGKISYFDSHRRFLPSDHPFRLDTNSFRKYNVVLKGPPRRLSSPEITDMLDNLALDKNENQLVEYGKKHNWTHKCGLWELSYVRALILMHNLDIMH